ncbi:cbb3-type cytochrome oxidase assembly protein CcoS [Colwellia sp. TT2012]|uniref:cbb3-type cytochrome oxidase assembly protein CcoS n=1 Tax=Colwellia sp. TT2012 TaxID=1720342 RepID=UPI003FA48167
MYILIPVAVILSILAIYLFFWAVKAEQFDDLEKQGMSILFDEEQPPKSNKERPDDEIASSTRPQKSPK